MGIFHEVTVISLQYFIGENVMGISPVPKVSSIELLVTIP
jgi:hypothetical protein